MNEWWAKSVSETGRLLESDPERGLDQAAAARLRSSHGPNELSEEPGRGPVGIFIDQFRDLIIWILMGAALVSGFLGEWMDAVAIAAIVVLNSILGFIQEYRAERSLAALRRLSSPTARVVRGGGHLMLPARDLVPGDLVELEAGDNIPADARIVWHSANFAVQEASLTGESVPVTKTGAPIAGTDIPLGDRANMVFMGTSVAAGRARALVTATGMGTELGRIAGMIQGVPREPTPLQRKLEEFGKWIVAVCLVLVTLIFGLGLLRGRPALEMFLTAVSLAVAAIPEGLPAVVTIALALGVRRMVKRHALIRKLPSVETLGCATVICTDKTGTLTRNEMTVRNVWAGGTLFDVGGVGYSREGSFGAGGSDIDPRKDPVLVAALECAALCNGAALADDGDGGIVGDPTEGALLVAAAKAGLLKKDLESEQPEEDEIPFDAERKKMTVIRREGGRRLAYVKGAPDVLLGDCTRLLDAEGERALTPDDRRSILAVNDDLTDRAMRVLAVARRVVPDDVDAADVAGVESDLTFLGLLAMIDPPREEAREAIRRCREAGIRTVMITGDHRNTAVAIARDLGLFEEGAEALTGEELDRLDETAFDREVERVAVYARVSPEHKLRIVRAWRRRGEVVAMTGDGVNDAPAVKEADIGVAMGITGTDVTKEVSDMVITDDNFASIVSAVEEGRGVYANIKKFVHYLLSCNAGEILVMLAATLGGMPLPLLPIQILWVNLVTDGLPALALGVDPAAADIMRQPARDPREPVVPRAEFLAMILEGAFIAACSLSVFLFELNVAGAGLDRARTMAFLVLAACQDFHSYNCRSRTESLFSLGFFSNRALVLATTTSICLQLTVIYTPLMQRVFRTVPLTLGDWALVLAIASLPLWAMEAAKLGLRRRPAAA